MPIFKRDSDPPPAPQRDSGQQRPSVVQRTAQQESVTGRSTYVSAADRAAGVASPSVSVSSPAAPPASPAPAATPPVASATPEVASRPSIAPPVNREAAAVIDRKTDITGTLHSQGHVLIEGLFQGEIEAKETVWVEDGAQTQGQIRANDAVISGSFDGEIVCQHRLQIAASATISGEIKTPVLVIEEGATVNCRFSMARAGR